jgi:G3E family GTPase
VFRAKGVLWFRESQLRYIFQLSGKRYDMQTDDWKKPPCNQLVLIGRNLNADQIQAELNDCLEPATAPIPFGA